MNLLLFTADDQISDGLFQIAISDRRVKHIQDVLKANHTGRSIKAGVLHGQIGLAVIEKQTSDHWVFSFVPAEEPPSPLPITLMLALPRPKMLRRVLMDAITLGIKHIILINSYKVEKSYWQTPKLNESHLQNIICLALEQSLDTIPPRIELKNRFKPFVEDELPTLCNGKASYLIHPNQENYLPCKAQHEALLAIGPEGGWTTYEEAKLLEQGFTPYAIGKRILRVETAVPIVVGRLMQLV